MEDLDVNQLVLAVQFSYSNNQREVNAAVFNQDKRMIQVCQFNDNEHFSIFESLILQVNPNAKDQKLTVLVQFPDLQTEISKIKDIFDQCEFEVVELQKKSFTMTADFEQSMDLILQRPLQQYIQESSIACNSMNCLLDYLRLAKDQSNNNKFSLEIMKLDQFMKLDLAALNALMIFPKVGQTSLGNNTLVEYLDRCKTAMGQRCLRRWIKMPLQKIDQINNRLEIVDYLSKNPSFRVHIQDNFLKKIPDLDKLYPKFYRVKNEKKHNTSLNDCLKIYYLVKNIKQFVGYVKNFQVEQKFQSIFLSQFQDVLNDFAKLEQMVEQSIDLDKAEQGEFIVNPKFSKKLLELNEQIESTMKQIERIRQQESSKLGINISLSDSANHTFVFEANKKQADEAFRTVPGKKYKTLTVKNKLLTFTLESLQEAVVDYAHLRSEYSEEQKTVVDKILQIVSGYYPAMEISSDIISQIDVYCSFSSVIHSAPRPFCKPIITNQSDFILKDSRHPLLEQINQDCMMNDLEMNIKDSRLHIITGPNMGGKSTYIRQIAISVLMAHIGCFVPCSMAQIPIMDAIITRVGASDMQMRGISTFMSEMLEASCMLKTASERSLIIIDELGRGTSTSEGFGIAWSIAEYIANEIKCFCLFATHFHEMTLMENESDCIKNYNVSCLITDDNKITMQYKVRRGAADRSYGLLVAEMLKFPEEVLNDAKQKAAELESFQIIKDQGNEESNSMDVEQFKSIEEEIEYYAKRCTLNQKEQVIKLMDKQKGKINKDLKLAILKLLKQ